MADGYRLPFWGDENVLELVVMVLHPCQCTKNHRTVPFKKVDFGLRELYVNFF